MPQDEMPPMQHAAPAAADPRRTAFFFDLDGTLAPLADTPRAVRVPAGTLAALGALARASGGAVAVVSGRALADLDRLLAPLRLAAAGQHGAELRGPGGRVRRLPADARRLAEMAASLEPLLARGPGLELERKGLALALHYRNAPALEEAARRAMEDALRGAEGFVLQPGKMVYEIKPRGASKGAAIAALMERAAFRGRLPLFAGDDLTDEAGFDFVQSQGGVSIKIGPGPTRARWRLASPDALAAWLGRLPGLGPVDARAGQAPGARDNATSGSRP